MADWRDTYWSFTVALQESEDIEVPIEFFYDEDGYIAHLIAMKTLTEEEYAQYGKLYSLISTYDKIFIEIIYHTTYFNITCWNLCIFNWLWILLKNFK